MSLQKRKRKLEDDFNLTCRFCSEADQKFEPHFLHDFFPDEITTLIMSFLSFNDMLRQWAHLKYNIREELYNNYFTNDEKDREFRIFRY